MKCISGLKDSVLFQSRAPNSLSVSARTENEGRGFGKSGEVEGREQGGERRRGGGGDNLRSGESTLRQEGERSKGVRPREGAGRPVSGREEGSKRRGGHGGKKQGASPLPG